ncbi:chromodomain protein, putative [Phytophthora infestans T30-4]|uniref:Chromodomain protein, putative n=2 Tax=Phytophthora infestans TaxID=4787 RepID=D0NA39_PHYIT|nr:chromodomain protein, putative [Phytophthora infestans T30-4]EEY54293.1 chromodomain protein, putative [Phytophthora infestans T30-4]KAF4043704.1 Calponin homology domain-containing proteinromo [Phytophthora infestans]KAF4149024.1 Chromo (CHRromatin Organization MOdifier) domain [Phytophthora infestans]|eukprot:XP_002904115.1 chromodomain protein, putative [Phytophthora infestans T30-4]
MTQDASARPKSPKSPKNLELFGKLHLGMDHVLSKLLPDAPPLPDALKLQTETQSVATTWVQITEVFEKRKTMLQRRKEKSKSKSKNSATKTKKKLKEKEPEKRSTTKTTKKSKSRSSSASPRSAKSSEKVKTTKKASSKKSIRSKTESDVAEVKSEEQLSSYDKSVLKRLRKLPMCQNVEVGTNKYRAIAMWMELDKGKNSATSANLMELLTKLQLEAASGKQNKPKLSRKRSPESLDDALRAEKSSKRKALARERRRSRQESFVDEDEVVYESGDEEEEAEYKGGYSDSDEAEFMPELENSPPPERLKKRRTSKKQKQEAVKQEKTAADTTQLSSKDQLAAVVAKIRADDVVSGKTDPKYLSYEKKGAPGSSSVSAIELDDSEEEEEGEEQEEEEEEEEETKGQDSSTDDENGMFDLNEEDVYIVEAILCVKEGRSIMSAGRRQQKEMDLYLVKWDGYNELTWEPEENIPQRLIEMFRERERAKRACQYQIKVAHERREVINVTTQQREVLYMIQWINQESAVWESRSTLPSKTQVWLDKVLGAPAAKKRRETKVVKQYIYH